MVIGKLDLYRIFQIVSQYSSFSKASEELYMTQSAVSQSIAKLEQELGVTLFYRTPKGIILTNEGKVLEEHVKIALKRFELAEDDILNFTEMKTGELRIGVGDTISRYFLLPYLEQFYANYPGINLKILNGTTTEIVSYLKEGEADVGVCHLPVSDKQITVLPKKVIHDIFVCTPSYREKLPQAMTYETLLTHPLIVLEKEANSRVYVESFIEKKGLRLKPVFELGSYDLVLDFAKINLGISCVVREFSTHYLNDGSLVELKLDEEIPARHVGLIHLKNYPLSKAAQKFVDSIKL